MARVTIVVGLGFGDEGKGSITDYLCRELHAKMVVRYNGGAQAGHNVVLPDGRHHCFAQFGSGSFLPGVETHLSRFMLVNPVFMESEAKHLIELGVTDIWDRITVDREALITNPFQVAANRLREMFRTERHGSCGMGIGETAQDALSDPEGALRAGDLLNPDVTLRKLLRSQERKLSEIEALPRRNTEGTRADIEWAILQDKSWAMELAQEVYKPWAHKVRLVTSDYLTWKLSEGTNAVFEGAQGVLLDENHGFHPNTTWSTTTFKNALDLLEGYSGEVSRVGVMRAHMTRHGAGPFPTEAKGVRLDGEHNQLGEWQGQFRVGHLDTPLITYARKVIGKLDTIALTHVDRLTDENQVCMCYGNPDLNSAMLKAKRPSLEHQERIGELLHEAKPAYWTWSKQKVLQWIRWGVFYGMFRDEPNWIYSTGPTWEHKSPDA